MTAINFEALFGASPNPYLLLDTSFRIVGMNDTYLRVTQRTRDDIVGRNLFDAFPSDPDSLSHRQLRNSLGIALRQKQADHLPLLRYDLPLASGQGFEERYWSATHTPLFDEAGEVAFILQHPVDVTELHRLRAFAKNARPPSDASETLETAVLRRAEAVQVANEALEAERQRLHNLFEQAPGFIAVMQGPDHIFSMANAAYHRLVGYRDILGKPLRIALPEVVEQGFLDLLDRVYETCQPFVGRSVRVMLAHGLGEPLEERYLDFVYQPIVAAEGIVTGIFVQGHDVTEQQRAGDALRESEQRFRLVADSAPVMLWMGDQAGKCVYLNKAQREFWNVTPDGIGSFDWSSSLHPDDRATLFEPFAHAMQTQTEFSVEARYRRADGENRILHTNAQPRFGANGEFLGMIGVNVDVTETRQAEAALRTETRLLEVLNRTGQTVASSLDLDKTVQTVTDAGVELTGAQFGAFFYNVLNDKGESYMLYALSGVPREAFSNFPMPRNTAIFEPTFKGDGVVRSDDILQDPRYGRSAPHHGMPKGHLPVRSYLAVPVRSRSGEVLGGLFFGHAQPAMFKAEHEALLVGIAGQAAIAIDNARLFQAAEREIRQRTEAEDQLRQLNETLEARVAEEIAERRQTEVALQQAQKMETIGKLTGGVAHDFNNLLQVVSGNLQLLAKDIAGDERAERRVANALAGISRGSKLASQLLAFGRRQPLEPKVVNIGRFISGMEDMLRRSIGEGVEVETIVSGGLWNSFIDPTQIENALLNLAINARDAMDGYGKLTIELGNAFVDDDYARNHADVEPGQYVMLAVTDTGSGMSPDVIEQAFEPFFSTKPEGKGTGLGLSMVYGFVKQSGGHVNIYSEVGQGTTIKLYLPRSDQSEDVIADVNAGPVTGGTETILIAEDDEEVRATVVEMLSDLGYRVLKAKDAASALMVIDSGIHIDLLFTDVVMPGALKSPELARKARERVPNIAVLFTSGYTENAIVHGGRLDAGVELLSKPYTREALARKLRHVLAGRAQRMSATAAKVPLVRRTPAGAKAAALTVLLVEDDPIIRMNTAEILEELGHAVIQAGSAEEAMAAAQEKAVDVLVTDLGLPGISGADFAAQLRSLRPDIGIVFATGMGEAPKIDGAATLLRKPYDERRLDEALREVSTKGARRPA